MEITAQKEKATGEKGRTSDRARTRDLRSLYCGVSATQAMETDRDPSSPITLMYQSRVLGNVLGTAEPATIT